MGRRNRLDRLSWIIVRLVIGPLAKEGFDAKEWQKFKMKSRPEIQLRGYGQLTDYHGVTGFLNTGKGGSFERQPVCPFNGQAPPTR